MKESALFYEDFMVYDENGKLKSYPSNSPENRPDGDFEGAKELSVSINSTMDFALLKELLSNLVSVAKSRNIDTECQKTWEKMLCAIPEYEINEDGAMKEWLHSDFKDNYQHRHQSHIYPLFPGFEINEDDTPKLYEACRVAVEKRLCIGLKAQTGWSFSHMANIFARLSNGEKAKECLDLLIRFCTGVNLYTHHNDWRNMGVTLKYMHAGHAPFQSFAHLLFRPHQQRKIHPDKPVGRAGGLHRFRRSGNHYRPRLQSHGAAAHRAGGACRHGGILRRQRFGRTTAQQNPRGGAENRPGGAGGFVGAGRVW